jgi:hypothetical protein
MTTINYKVEFYDPSFKLLKIINKEASVNFEWTKGNGCGRFNITLARRFDNYTDIVTFGNAVKIYINNVLWYQGYIQDYNPHFQTSESVDIVGMGYIEQLTFSEQTNFYSNIEVSDLVLQLVEAAKYNNNLDVNIDPLKIENTGFFIDEIVFKNQNIKDCIQTLRDLIPYFDWGVDETRTLFFQSVYSNYSLWDVAYWDVNYWENILIPSQVVYLKTNVESYEPIYSSTNIINRLLIVGGKSQSSDNLFFVANEPQSQLIYKVREASESVPSITTQLLADAYAQTRFLDVAYPNKRVSIQLRNYPVLLKPRDIIEVRDSDGNKLDSHMAINISYTIDDSGLQTSIECDRPLPYLAYQFNNIKRDITALQNQNQNILSFYQLTESVFYDNTGTISLTPGGGSTTTITI